MNRGSGSSGLVKQGRSRFDCNMLRERLGFDIIYYHGI